MTSVVTKRCVACGQTKDRELFVANPYTTRWGKPHVRRIPTCQQCYDAGRTERVSLPKKQCITCSKWKPASSYYRHSYVTKTGRHSTRFESNCRTCKKLGEERRRKRKQSHRIVANRYSASGRGQVTLLRHRLKTYGLTEAEYVALLAAQGGRCAICRAEPGDGKWQRLQVDHCHETGVVRGILCRHCNTALGHAKDNRATLAAMIAYLDRHQAVGVAS